MSESQSDVIRLRPTSRHYYIRIRIVNIIVQIICLVACICIIAIPEEILNPNHDHDGRHEQATKPILALVAVAGGVHLNAAELCRTRSFDVITLSGTKTLAFLAVADILAFVLMIASPFQSWGTFFWSNAVGICLWFVMSISGLLHLATMSFPFQELQLKRRKKNVTEGNRSHGIMLNTMR
ncbi:hypothetical protein E6O75_ATG06324 [Venturia nashicola]|uniref:Uncharacterized protein n=1 Tax=Venturia nashicola TaxID=86259 RepID=A0A4Z1PB91_9PEZI|nr:hypothetical protein E6O75_ATG06324 [Venturia nashicola]